ncbi:hypothetical protein HK096_006345 [Nowakowskiella sp. JEL0078]|nr:hypothetical protein HK096_006345 [Nowakowskiella sp. JEL0078]
MNKQEKTFHQEYLALTDDYKRITEQFKGLQKKFRHFQISDSKKYRDVWRMNEELAKDLMRKVLQADRIIHEHQLGMHWTPPKEDLFRNIDPSFFANSGKIFYDPDANSNDSTKSKAKSGSVRNGEPGRPTMASEDSLAALVAAAASEHSEKEAAQVLARPSQLGTTINQPMGISGLIARFKDHKGYSKIIKKMLELLCNEAGFLVEDKLQKLLVPLHKDEQYLIKLDSIFKALGIETVEDIERLASHFVVDVSSENDFSEDRKEQNSVETNGENISGAEKLTTEEMRTINATKTTGNSIVSRLVHPNDVIKSVRKFVEEKEKDCRTHTSNNPLKSLNEFEENLSPKETAMIESVNLENDHKKIDEKEKLDLKENNGIPNQN